MSSNLTLDNPDQLDQLEKKIGDSNSSVNVAAQPTVPAPWWKFDLVILPIATGLYLLNFLDRANIGNARVAGMQKQLHMTNFDYSMVLTVLYIPYVLIELPSNLVLKRWGAHYLLPGMVAAWGATTAFQGLVTSYAGLLVCRVFLGLFEGGLLPGLVLYLSAFYPRSMLQSRISAFFASSALAGAFSGLLAAAILKLDGTSGKPGWAWIFIIEGVITVGVGIFCFFVMPHTYNTTSILTSEEKVAVKAAILAEGSQEDDKFVAREAFAVCYQPQVWSNAIIGFFGGTQLYALAYFAPSIVSALGYKRTQTQLMTVPPLAVAWVFSMVMGVVSDRFKWRGITTCISAGVSIIGYAIYYSTDSPKLRYGSMFLSVSGAYAAPASIFAWVANNSAGHYRRAVSLAILLVFTNCGGIFATWLFGTVSLAPYKKATLVCLIFCVIEIVLAIATILYLTAQNRRKKNGLISKSYLSSDDRHPKFVYTL